MENADGEKHVHSPLIFGQTRRGKEIRKVEYEAREGSKTGKFESEMCVGLAGRDGCPIAIDNHNHRIPMSPS